MRMRRATLETDLARAFAAEWIDAWNSHDLERVLCHYATDIELTSMFVPHILGITSNTLRGIGMLRLYFSEALAKFPGLKFLPRGVYSGVDSLVVEYDSISGLLTAEMMGLNERGLISRVYVHYCEARAAEEIPIGANQRLSGSGTPRTRETRASIASR